MKNPSIEMRSSDIFDFPNDQMVCNMHLMVREIEHKNENQNHTNAKSDTECRNIWYDYESNPNHRMEPLVILGAFSCVYLCNNLIR